MIGPFLDGVFIGLGIVFTLWMVWGVLKFFGRRFQRWVLNQVHTVANDSKFVARYDFNGLREYIYTTESRVERLEVATGLRSPAPEPGEIYAAIAPKRQRKPKRKR